MNLITWQERGLINSQPYHLALLVPLRKIRTLDRDKGSLSLYSSIPAFTFHTTSIFILQPPAYVTMLLLILLYDQIHTRMAGVSDA